MNYINNEFKFKLSIPDDYRVIDDKQFFIESLGMSAQHAKQTILYLFKSDNTHALSMTRDTFYEDLRAYEQGIELNKENMRKNGLEIYQDTRIQNNNQPLNKIIVQAANGIMISNYFTYINKLMVCLGTQIQSPSDKYDLVAQEIISSIHKI